MPGHQGAMQHISVLKVAGMGIQQIEASAPPDIDTDRPAPLSPFRLSVSLPPRNKSMEPRSRGQKRIQEMQRELDAANEDLANKNEGLNEQRELVGRLKGQVARGLFLRLVWIFIIHVPFGEFWLSLLFVWPFSLAWVTLTP